MQTWACRRPKSQLLPWTCLRRNHGLAFGFSVGLLSVQLIHPGVTHGFVSRDHIWRACVGGKKLKVKLQIDPSTCQKGPAAMAKAQAHVPSRRRKIESEKLQKDLSTCQKRAPSTCQTGPAAMAKVRAVGPCALSVPLIHPGVKWLCFQRANSAVRGGMLKVEKWYNEPSRAVSTCQTGLAARANSRARN